MLCPNCQNQALATRLTKQGVEVDTCPTCKGIWLDRGEIFLLVKNKRAAQSAFERGMAKSRPSKKLSPKSGRPMLQFPLVLAGVPELQLDICEQTGGLWFDAGELKKIVEAGSNQVSPHRFEVDERVDSTQRPRTAPAAAAGAVVLGSRLMRLPNLFFRSAATLTLLYGVLGLLLISAVEFGGLDSGFALLFGAATVLVQFILGPWIMDLSLRWVYDFEWVEFSELPEHLRQFVERICRQQKLSIPRFGIIRDSAPNAFTYGHHPGNARVVVTRGILEMLEPAEVEAVVAHEMGHIKHWDMLLMTLAHLVPLVLYYIYKTLSRVRSNNRKHGGQAAAVAAVAYVLYLVAEYVVLWFSRTREYHADRFAGYATKNPNVLVTSLVKIAYGLAGRKKETAPNADANATRNSNLEAMSALGIFDLKAAQTVAISSFNASPAAAAGELDPQSVADAMKWDLWNPWAKYYELGSTHPLVANRLQHLANQAQVMGVTPFIQFDQRRPESYWDEFFIDLGILWLPGILGAATLLLTIPLGSAGVSLALAMVGVGSLVKVLFSYQVGFFSPLSVAALLKRVKVSGVRPIPCTLKGTIVGRGVPGLMWSEDFVLRDDTGIIFLDYRQPFRFWEFLFGLMRGKEMVNQEATVTGWYRRSPVPYIEIKTLVTGGDARNCYVYHLKIFSALSMIIGGVVLALL